MGLCLKSRFDHVTPSPSARLRINSAKGLGRWSHAYADDPSPDFPTPSRTRDVVGASPDYIGVRMTVLRQGPLMGDGQDGVRQFRLHREGRMAHWAGRQPGKEWDSAGHGQLSSSLSH